MSVYVGRQSSLTVCVCRSTQQVNCACVYVCRSTVYCKNCVLRSTVHHNAVYECQQRVVVVTVYPVCVCRSTEPINCVCRSTALYINCVRRSTIHQNCVAELCM